jgi:predicted MPP superfamily phosphohydrolase
MEPVDSRSHATEARPGSHATRPPAHDHHAPASAKHFEDLSEAELGRWLIEAQSRGLLALLDRFDSDHLGARLRRQVDHVLRFFGVGPGAFHFEELDFLFPLIDVGLSLVGLKEKAVRNVLNPTVTQHEFRFENLPVPFDGLRILHLSDLHLDCRTAGLSGLGMTIRRSIEQLKFDLCIITGDFRYDTQGDYIDAMRQTALLAPALECELGAFGTLGNHDFIEQVPILEELGIRMLVNEQAVVTRQGRQVWLAGTDDAHFYRTADMNRALAGIPDNSFIIGLVHSPELAKQEAARKRISLYLCGHTHAGQLCLPWGLARVRSSMIGVGDRLTGKGALDARGGGRAGTPMVHRQGGSGTEGSGYGCIGPRDDGV